MEKAEDRMLGIDDLGDDEEFHEVGWSPVKYDLRRVGVIFPKYQNINGKYPFDA